MNEFPLQQHLHLQQSFGYVLFKISQLLPTAKFDENNYVEALALQAYQTTRSVASYGMGTYIEDYYYRLPYGPEIILTIQSNAVGCNPDHSDGLNIHGHVVNIIINQDGFSTNPLIPIDGGNELTIAQHKVLLFLTELSVRLELSGQRKEVVNARG